MDIISPISHSVRIICLPQMHVAPLYRLYSAKSHVFVSGMRRAAFISTGHGKAGHSEVVDCPIPATGVSNGMAEGADLILQGNRSLHTACRGNTPCRGCCLELWIGFKKVG